MKLKLKDIKWIGKNSGSYSGNTRSGWKMFYMDPPVKSSHFEFSFRVDSMGSSHYIGIGVSTEKQDTGPDQGTENMGTYSSGWYSYGNKIKHPDSEGNMQIVKVPTTTLYKENSVIGVKVDKKRGFIEWYLDGKLVIKVERLKFPKELYIAADIYSSINMSLVEFRDHRPFVPGFFVSADSLEKEEIERLEYVMENMADLEIPIRSKSIKLPKTLLVCSNIDKKDLRSKEFKYKETIPVDVDEDKIYRFLLNKKLGSSTEENEEEDGEENLLNEENVIRGEDLYQYYLFFKKLGLKKEMMSVVHRISEIEDFRTLFSIFSEFSKEYETDCVKSWFSPKPQIEGKVSEIPFETSFAVALMNQMKDREEEFTKNPELMLLPSAGVLFYNLMKWEVRDLTLHKDFEGFNFKKNFYSVLLDYRNDFSNLTLTSSDGEKTKAFAEIVMLKSNFFFRMIRFGGTESEQMQNQGNIDLVGVGYNEVGVMMDFFHEKPIEEDDLEILIRCLVFAEKYQEQKYFSTLLERIELVVEDTAKKQQEEVVEEIEEVIRKIGFLLKSKEVRTQLIPRLCDVHEWLTEEKIRTWIKESGKKTVSETELDLMKSKINELEEKDRLRDLKVFELEKKLENLTKIVDSLKKKEE